MQVKKELWGGRKQDASVHVQHGPEGYWLRFHHVREKTSGAVRVFASDCCSEIDLVGIAACNPPLDPVQLAAELLRSHRTAQLLQALRRTRAAAGRQHSLRLAVHAEARQRQPARRGSKAWQRSRLPMVAALIAKVTGNPQAPAQRSIDGFKECG